VPGRGWAESDLTPGSQIIRYSTAREGPLYTVANQWTASDDIIHFSKVLETPRCQQGASEPARSLVFKLMKHLA
jgi:hypothetical protein